MKLYFSQSAEGLITHSSYPVKETGATSYEFEIEEADLLAVESGEKDWLIEEGQLSTIPSTRKQDQIDAEEATRLENEALEKEKEEMKEKLQKGQASNEEIQKLLAKLL